MKRFKLVFTLTLTFVLISTLAQATVFETVNGLNYSIDTEKNEASLVTNGSRGYSGDIVVPEKIAFGVNEYPVTSLGDYCFYYCYDITSITLPSSVTSLGNYCFLGCISLKSIIIPSSVKSLGIGCFESCCGLTSITIPSSITSLGDYCLFCCSSLTSITLPESISSLGNHCLEGCSKLTSIDIPSSVTSFGVFCFASCFGLTSITIPPSVTSMENGCFFCCKGLTSVSIPSSVTSLRIHCFEYCLNLKSITIPSSVTVLESSCFFMCPNLTSISCDATIPPKCYEDISIGFNFSSCKLYVPQKSIAQYKAANGWKSFPNIYAIEGSGESDQISNTSTSDIITTCNNGIITISGLNAHENVTFYSLSGKQLGTAKAVDGTATYAMNSTGDIVIAKFGGTSMKIARK